MESTQNNQATNGHGGVQAPPPVKRNLVQVHKARVSPECPAVLDLQIVAAQEFPLLTENQMLPASRAALHHNEALAIVNALSSSLPVPTVDAILIHLLRRKHDQLMFLDAVASR